MQWLSTYLFFLYQSHSIAFYFLPSFSFTFPLYLLSCFLSTNMEWLKHLSWHSSFTLLPTPCTPSYLRCTLHSTYTHSFWLYSYLNAAFHKYDTQSLDPYTEFENLGAAKNMLESVSGKYGGVGLIISGSKGASSMITFITYGYNWVTW